MAAHDPDLHLPLGAGSVNGGAAVPLCRTGDRAVRLDQLCESGVLDGCGGGLGTEAFHSPTLDPILAAGPEAWAGLRSLLIEFVNDPACTDQLDELSADLDRVTMVLPFTVSDYVDFYSSLHHATNVGRIFRPDSDPLLPNWRHLPVGYHGRSASIAVSGTQVHRPAGLRLIDGAPHYGPSLALDHELELGFVVGIGNQGVPLATSEFAEHVFGVCLVNDWSARDIQSFEYQPLGPFLGKSFHTSISPWITPLAALDDFRVESPGSAVNTAGYLHSTEPWGLDLRLEVSIESARMREIGIEPMTLSRASFADMAWTPDQQLAHLTVNGSTIRTGDFYASGTVSGPDYGEEGSLLERTSGGTVPITLPDGTERSYLLDGDRVILSGHAGGGSSSADADGDGQPVRLGEVSGTIVSPRRANERSTERGPR